MCVSTSIIPPFPFTLSEFSLYALMSSLQQCTDSSELPWSLSLIPSSPVPPSMNLRLLLQGGVRMRVILFINPSSFCQNIFFTRTERREQCISYSKSRLGKRACWAQLQRFDHLPWSGWEGGLKKTRSQQQRLPPPPQPTLKPLRKETLAVAWG